jgi:hypothetical protein
VPLRGSQIEAIKNSHDLLCAIPEGSTDYCHLSVEAVKRRLAIKSLQLSFMKLARFSGIAGLGFAALLTFNFSAGSRKTAINRHFCALLATANW